MRWKPGTSWAFSFLAWLPWFSAGATGWYYTPGKGGDEKTREMAGFSFKVRVRLQQLEALSLSKNR
nr:hypothetical protein [Pseudomonas aeruginosa]